MNQNFKKYLGIYGRGIAMGAADVVPGVSGGTIAFISGIYQELLDTIKGINITNIKGIKKDGLKVTWNKLNGNFLLSLVLGIGTSIVSLASLISGILEVEGETKSKIGLWSFFFGLIVASIIYVAKQVQKWGVGQLIGLAVGAALAYYITIAGVAAENDSLMFLFFAGAIAISAMILPGISGSFILVLMGAYKPIMGAIKGIVEALKQSDMAGLVEYGSIITVVGLGCIVGLLSFSRVLSWLFKHHEQITLTTLVGFMLGSLNKIWPWKEVVDFRINSEGLKVPVVTQNLLPGNYESIYQINSEIGFAVILAIVGFAVVFTLEFLGKKFKNEQ